VTANFGRDRGKKITVCSSRPIYPLVFVRVCDETMVPCSRARLSLDVLYVHNVRNNNHGQCSFGRDCGCRGEDCGCRGEDCWWQGVRRAGGWTRGRGHCEACARLGKWTMLIIASATLRSSECCREAECVYNNPTKLCMRECTQTCLKKCFPLGLCPHCDEICPNCCWMEYWMDGCRARRRSGASRMRQTRKLTRSDAASATTW